MREGCEMREQAMESLLFSPPERPLIDMPPGSTPPTCTDLTPGLAYTGEGRKSFSSKYMSIHIKVRNKQFALH
jgi:hypothetical protein